MNSTLSAGSSPTSMAACHAGAKPWKLPACAFAVMLTARRRGALVQGHPRSRSRKPGVLMRLKWALAAALAAGVAHTAAFAPGFLWWLQILSLATLFGLAWNAGPRRAAALGAAFGTGWLASGLWWLYISMHQFGGIPSVLRRWRCCCWPFFSACTTPLRWRWEPGWAGVGGWPFSRRAGCWPNWRAASWLSGFPWLASGYAHSIGPLAAWAPWIGVYGIAGLAAASAASLAALGRIRDWKPLAASIVVVLAGQLLPQQFTTSTGRLRVSLLQPNVPQDEKFDRGLIDANLERLARQIESARGQLVVTPESVVPLPLAFLGTDYVDRLQRAATRRPLLLGTFLGNEHDGYGQFDGRLRHLGTL